MGYHKLTEEDKVTEGKLVIEKANERMVGMICLKDHYDTRREDIKRTRGTNALVKEIHDNLPQEENPEKTGGHFYRPK